MDILTHEESQLVGVLAGSGHSDDSLKQIEKINYSMVIIKHFDLYYFFTGLNAVGFDWLFFVSPSISDWYIGFQAEGGFM